MTDSAHQKTITKTFAMGHKSLHAEFSFLSSQLNLAQSHESEMNKVYMTVLLIIEKYYFLNNDVKKNKVYT